MYIGIDIGGTNIKGLLTDPLGNELSFTHIHTPKTAKDIDEKIYQLIETLASSASISITDIKAIGIGTPGPIDRDAGIIIKAPNIPCFDNHPLVKNIRRRIDIPVILENDATIALIGTWWKEIGHTFRNWIMITLGTGIGGGLVIDNKMYTGISGNAMEIGHMCIDYNGKRCGCGSRGCWERYASATALVELARSKLKGIKNSSIVSRTKKEQLTPRVIYEEALNNDKLALKIFNEYSSYLGIGIVNLINIFNPEAIFVGGGISRTHTLMMPIVKKIVAERALQGLKDEVQFFAVKDPDKIPSFGAVKIAIESMQ